MNITFEQDGETRRWDRFKPDRLLATEAEAIEKVTGMTFGQWGQALMNGSALAGRALVWVLQKREDAPLRFRDVDFPIGDLSVDLDDDERARVRAELERNTDLSDEDRQQMLDALGEDDAAADASPAEDDAVDGPGNVPATVSAAA